MARELDLKAPVLLMAMPQVMDPFFHRSVVFLVHHEAEGSFGFIVNRPTGILAAEILKDLKISWHGDPGALAYFGGPVQPQLGTVLFNSANVDNLKPETTIEVYPGVGITQHIGDLAALAQNPPQGLRLFLGYAGWGEGQLVQEILRNDWLMAPVGEEIIFASEPDGAWDVALRSVGVDPESLPSWTSGDDSAN